MTVGSKWDKKRKWDLAEVIFSVISAILLVLLAYLQTH